MFSQHILSKLKNLKTVKEIETILYEGPFLLPTWKGLGQKIWIHREQNFSVRLQIEDNIKERGKSKLLGT